MSDLIGKKFKRNKYGLSKWTDTVTETYFMKAYFEVNGKLFYKPILMVRGTRIHSHNIDEIVLFDE